MPPPRRRRSFTPDALPEQVVAHPNDLAEAVEHIGRHAVIGFDTEFVGEHTYRPDLCLLQVSTAERLLIIDPYECGPLDAFWDLLHDPARVLVVHAGREEVRMCHFHSGRSPGNLFDLQIAAGLIGLTYPIGYAGLVQIVLGGRLNKSDTLTDWRRRPLTDSQIRYAFDDVRYLIPAYTRVLQRLRKHDRVPWATDEFGAFIGRSLADGMTVERWRKIKGVGALNRRELAVARGVYGWREDVAERQNRPPRTVIRDDLLIELARRGARNADDVLSLRGLPRGEADTIHEVVRTANAIPLSSCPEVIEGDFDPPQIGILSCILSVVLSDVCERMKLATSLVCSMQDLKDLARSRQAGGELPDDSPFQTGWRRQHVLPALTEVLDGGTSIRIADPRSGAPLEYVELEDDDEDE